MSSARIPSALLIVLLALSLRSVGSAQPAFNSARRLITGEVSMEMALPAGSLHRIEISSDTIHWQGLATLAGAATVRSFTDGSTGPAPMRFYRIVTVEETNAITGDHLPTAGADVVVHPVNHASFALKWGDRFIYNDPVGGTTPYKGLPRPDLILVSHTHGDHFDSATLDAVRKEGTVIVAPAAVYSSLSTKLKALTIPLANGQETNLLDLKVTAIPAYNGNHPKGAGNGYVVTLGGRRLFMSGDTGNIPEMRALTDIDVAFVCMNVPFTMTIAEAVTAVRAFRPRVVYPYHYRNSDGSPADVAGFKRQVGADPSIEVRLRTWY